MQATQEKVSVLWKRLEIAKFFGISTATVRRWERGVGGKLPDPACWIAGRPYWNPDDIRALLGKSGA